MSIDSIDSIDLSTITLHRGSHLDRSDGLCINEVVAWLAGEPHGDNPSCVCPVLRRLTMAVNDRMRDAGARTRLLMPYAPRLIGTAGDPAATQRRTYIVADWAVREIAPIALDAAGMVEQAAILRALPPIVNQETARQAAAAANAAAAYADYAAAYANAYDQFVAAHLPPLMERLLAAS